jgi:NodT family efflux transporter outer membrane factor (OMF) lipoprotein
MSEAEVMKTNKRHLLLIKVWVLCMAVLTASGCMVGPDYVRPRTTVPAEWAGVAEAPKGQSSAATTGEPGLTQWWLQFNDPAMTGLVEEALKANLDLKTAEAVVRQARASRGIAFGALLPSVGSSAGYQRARTMNSPSDQNLFQAGLDAVWELDIFGGLHRNLEAADASIEAAVENMHDVQVSLVAEVALNYIQLRGYQQEILVAQKSLQAQQQTADITRKLFNAGFDTALDIANADAAVATTDAQIPVYETAAQQSIYALSILLARPPADLLKQLLPEAGLPSVPAQVPIGLPSGLLRRRPDVKAAEAQLHAATAQIGVAVADFYPQFSLTGSVNWNSNLLRTWWNTASRTFGVGPSVTWPIFQGGAIAANVQLQEALRDQAFIAYQKTVLTAFQDVENALIAFSKEQRHRTLLSDAVAANRKAVALSLELYTGGQNNFLTVTTAQQYLYTAENALVQSNCNIATDLIALYKALGGGGELLPSRADTP